MIIPGYYYIMSFLNFLYSYKYLSSWLILNGLLAFYTKKKLVKYYDPKYIQVQKTNKDGSVSETTVNVHEEYPEFSRHDDYPSFFKLWIGFCTVLWIKGSSWLFLLFLIWLDCK